MNNLSILNTIAKSYDRLVSIASSEALRFYKQRFDEQSWADYTSQPWKRARNNRRKTLINTGTLKRSIRVVSISNTSTDTKIKIASSEKYAQIHNEGGRITVTPKMKKFFWFKYLQAQGNIKTNAEGRARNTQRNRTLSAQAQTFKALALTKKPFIQIPKRQFLGPSTILEKRIARLLQAKISTILQKN